MKRVVNTKIVKKGSSRKNTSINTNIHNSKKENNVLRLIMIIVLIISIGILIGTISYTIHKIHEHNEYVKRIIVYKEMTASVEVTLNRVGINGDIDGLKFGKNTAGGGGTRYIDINSSEKAIVRIYLSGDIAPYLSVDENDFIINAGESRRVPVYLDLPSEIPIGNYTSKVEVVLLRP